MPQQASIRHFLLRLMAALLLWSFAPGLFSQSADSIGITGQLEDLPITPVIVMPSPAGPDDYEVELPEVFIQHVSAEVKITYKGEDGMLASGPVEMWINGSVRTLDFEGGTATFQYAPEGSGEIKIERQGYSYVSPVSPIPLWLSIVPPLLAIIMALVFREVITALFMGIFFGAAVIHVYMWGIMGIGSGLFAVLDTYVLEALTDPDHVSIIIFSMLIGGIVAVISRNGGMLGVVNRVSKVAKDARSGQMATWGLGVGIFFDDYANTLVVGNTMRPVTDRLRISREKLSYLVDSTAAPIAAIAFITTWIGAELGYINDGIESLEIAGTPLPASEGAYGIFLSSLQYMFYPVLTLIFMLILIRTGRDYGPMYHAEVRARSTGQVSRPSEHNDLDREKRQELDDLDPVKGAKARAYNAVIPILVVIIGTIIGLYYTGMSSLKESFATDPEASAEFYSLGFFGKLSPILGAANSYAALIWASMAGMFTAITLTMAQRIMSLESCIESMLSGFKHMLHAMLILILAWALAKTTQDLHTSDFLIRSLQDNFSPYLIPAMTFLMAALVSFSTGSSWSTMAILYPLLISAAWKLSLSAGLTHEEALPILYNTVACVLAGSVLGDHCSPISDTTILSSLASSCNHIDHVRSQLPYALTVGLISVAIGTMPSALGIPFWLSFPLAIAALYAVVMLFGKRVEVAQPTE